MGEVGCEDKTSFPFSYWTCQVFALWFTRGGPNNLLVFAMPLQIRYENCHLF